MRPTSARKPKIFKIRIRKDDTVMIRSGKYKGRSGKVLAVHPALNKVTIEGINVVKKHVKPNRQHPQGAIVELTQPIWVSKVGLVDPAHKSKPSRVGYKLDAKGGKNRIYKTSGKEVK